MPTPELSWLLLPICFQGLPRWSPRPPTFEVGPPPSSLHVSTAEEASMANAQAKSSWLARAIFSARAPTTLEGARGWPRAQGASRLALWRSQSKAPTARGAPAPLIPWFVLMSAFIRLACFTECSDRPQTSSRPRAHHSSQSALTLMTRSCLYPSGLLRNNVFLDTWRRTR